MLRDDGDIRFQYFQLLLVMMRMMTMPMVMMIMVGMMLVAMEVHPHPQRHAAHAKARVFFSCLAALVPMASLGEFRVLHWRACFQLDFLYAPVLRAGDRSKLEAFGGLAFTWIFLYAPVLRACDRSSRPLGGLLSPGFFVRTSLRLESGDRSWPFFLVGISLDPVRERVGSRRRQNGNQNHSSQDLHSQY